MSASMIDWNLAVQTGTRLVRPGPQISHAEAREVVAELRDLSKIAHGHVREFTGMAIEDDPEPATVVDRPGWIRANVDGFRVVFEPLMDRMQSKRGAGLLGDGPGGAIVQAVGSRVTGVQVGVILSYMAGRVLGQYELFLPPDPQGRAATGRLTLVAPNIVHVERELEVDPHDFRLWVCLHEETHRAQFTGVPWLREYVQSQMTEFLLASDLDTGAMLERIRDAADVITDAFRGGEGSLIDAIQTPEQRAILDRITAVMTLAEGHGDYVMDAVGPGVVPSVEQIRNRFQGRREGGGRLDKAIRRLLGFDLKMKQYAEGSRFVRTVVEQVGMADFNRVWESPQTLPTLDEIKAPELWIDRVVRARGLGAAPLADAPLTAPPTGGTPPGPAPTPPDAAPGAPTTPDTPPGDPLGGGPVKGVPSVDDPLPGGLPIDTPGVPETSVPDVPPPGEPAVPDDLPPAPGAEGVPPSGGTPGSAVPPPGEPARPGDLPPVPGGEGVPPADGTPGSAARPTGEPTRPDIVPPGGPDDEPRPGTPG